MFAYEEHERQFLVLDKGPEKQLELKAVIDEVVISSAISPDGCWLVYSTTNFVRMFMVDSSNKGLIKIFRIKDLHQMIAPTSKLFFSADSNSLKLVNANNDVVLFQILTIETLRLETSHRD